jgi:hypothetical protein
MVTGIIEQQATKQDADLVLGRNCVRVELYSTRMT